MASVTEVFTTLMTNTTDLVTSRDERYTTKGECQICIVIIIVYEQFLLSDIDIIFIS